VGKGQSGSTSAKSVASGQSQTNTNTKNTSGDDIFVRLEFDKHTAYVGEQITAWIKIYTRIGISDFDRSFKGPEFVGFYRQEIELSGYNFERERVGDDIYNAGIIQKFILYPQKSGEITIDPFDLLVVIQKQIRRKQQGFFDPFFGPSYENKRINLRSNQARLTIKSLPGGQPTGFTGAVGHFKMNATANLDEVMTNDAITFKVTVSGKGNIKLIDEVVNGFPPTFDVFDPIKKVQFDPGSENRSGSVSFEYTAIPRHPGNFVVEPFSLVYFDPETGKYQTLRTRSFTIQANKGNEDSTTLVTSNLTKEDIELLGSDIRYIEDKTTLRPAKIFIFGKPWFNGIYLGSILLFIIILVVRKEQLRRSADVARYRNRKAGKLAASRLKNAARFLKANDMQSFYDELERALWDYLANKLNIQLSELSAEKAAYELQVRNLADDIRKEFMNIIETCQYARYAPGGMESQMTGLYDRSVAVINKLEQKL
jgi:hypothetical protein